MPKKKLVGYALVFFSLLGSCWLVYASLILKPSNQRNWEAGMDILASVQLNNNLISFHNVRDFRFQPSKIVSGNYIDRSVDVNDLEKVWYLVELFGAFGGVAHSYFVFDFKN